MDLKIKAFKNYELISLIMTTAKERFSLLDGILYNLNLTSSEHNGLAMMLWDQLIDRWNVFCRAQHHDNDHEADQVMPWSLVQQFMNKNLEWAKVKVMVRVNRMLWPNDDLERDVCTYLD